MHPALLPIIPLLEESNIGQFDRDKFGRILAAILDECQVASNDIMAVSEGRGRFLVVWKTGHVTAAERGLFNRRIEIDRPVHYGEPIHLARSQKGVRGRDGMLIEGFNAASDRMFELSWGCGGPVTEENAAEERDRIFTVMQHLVGAAVS